MPIHQLPTSLNNHSKNNIGRAKRSSNLIGNKITVVNGLLNERQVAKLTGRAVTTLQKDRVDGTGCAFVKLGKRMVRYRIEDVQEWIASNLRRSTSDPGSGPAAA